jgi:hypothetical protein
MNDPQYREREYALNRKRYAAHREENQAKERDYNKRLKIEVLTHYSSKGYLSCSCPKCDIIILDFLTIDHVDGDGLKHIRAIGVSGGTQFYGWLRKGGFPPEFQTLCYNCNCGRGKKRRNGICPHFQV